MLNLYPRSLIILLIAATTAGAAEPIADLLYRGELAKAEETLGGVLKDNPDNALATAQLGAVQVFAAVEQLGQANYRFGTGATRAGRQFMPFFRMRVEPNPDPQVVEYSDVRKVVREFIDALVEAEATLAGVGDEEVKWKLDLSAVQLDLDGDGEATAEESVGWLIEGMTRRRRGAEEVQPFVIGVDTADVYWLRGYCHVLSAMGETLLAYDQQRTFDHTAQLVFPKAKVEHEFLSLRPEKRGDAWMMDGLDAIAMIHLADWPLVDGERLQVAHEHLLAMVETSRANWRAILAEKDDDHEWIPGPNQKSVVPGGQITQAQIDAWHVFLEEAEDLLEGKKLAPFWRDETKGVNLRRVFYEPTRFDLVLWIQGSAAAPYLEEGEQTDPQTWQSFQRVFRGNFIGFAFWIN